ncbi:hypothetical protein EJ110_NYTH31138 [Nymphaea thermarum]|nr:hypothetical protein EJ110_NYTH31138 [Nymphaea thermarum]
MMSSSEAAACEPEMNNKATVEALYEALALGDAETASNLLAADLEWWFHGPPSCQYMMRILTGQSTHREFTFLPQNVTAIGAKVFVEGWEGDSVYWVHVWTVKDGTITQVREYFNTWITVQDLRPLTLRSGRPAGPTLWKSDHADHCSRSLPGLLVAI